MPHHVVAPSLELEQDADVQRREWRFERAGWLVIVVVVVGALAGLFGDGPFSRRTGQSATAGATIEYERVVRAGSAARLTLTADASSPADSMMEVGFDRRYVESMDLQHVTPEPVETRASSAWVLYRFRRVDAGRPATIDFTFSPNSVGSRRVRVSTAFGELEMPQLVLP